MPMKKRLSSSIGAIIVLCAIIIISLQKYQPDKEVITTFIYEWLNDDSRAETEYKKILETGSDNQSLSQPLQKYFITEASFQSFLKTFYYLPVKILQQYDSYNLTDINITKESNSYFVKVDLELIKEEKSKNESYKQHNSNDSDSNESVTMKSSMKNSISNTILTNNHYIYCQHQ